MEAPCPMPCHIARLLVVPALIIVAPTAATPSFPTIGSLCTPSSITGIFRFLGACGADPLGQFRHLTRLSAPTAPNCGYSLGHATQSSRTRAGVGPVSA